VAATAPASRLRALLLARDDTDRQAEIRRLALALGQARRQLKENGQQLLAIVNDLAPGSPAATASGQSAPSTAPSTPSR
jgi:hypothetical protein